MNCKECNSKYVEMSLKSEDLDGSVYECSCMSCGAKYTQKTECPIKKRRLFVNSWGGKRLEKSE